MNAVTQIVRKARRANQQAVLFFRFGEYQHSEPLFTQARYLMKLARLARASRCR